MENIVTSRSLKAPHSTSTNRLGKAVPHAIRSLGQLQSDIPQIAKNKEFTRQIEVALKSVETQHDLFLGDARDMSCLEDQSVHLVLTSPPYWTLKKYRSGLGQLGHVENYEEFHEELNKVWTHCYRALVPGGRLVCVVGDVCLSRRNNDGRHSVIPLHATIQENCRRIGFDNLAPIFWYKISNAKREAGGAGAFLGKPYEPNAVIKNDVEFILMLRKPGYRKPEMPAKLLSIISDENYHKWFQQIWTNVPGASTKDHPAPYPSELAERLVRMFSFAGDTVLDPFMGTATTNAAAAAWGRDSVGFEIDPVYFRNAKSRLENAISEFFVSASINTCQA